MGVRPRMPFFPWTQCISATLPDFLAEESFYCEDTVMIITEREAGCNRKYIRRHIMKEICDFTQMQRNHVDLWR